MKDSSKTKQALTQELASLKERITELEQSESERKRAEEALRMLAVRNEAILAAVPDIIMEVDGCKRYTWANQAGMRFFGEDVVGREASYYFEGEQETYNKVQPLFDGAEDVIYIESWQRRKDGEKRLLSWWCKVLKDKKGLVTGALSTSRDITSRQQTEKALRASEEKYRSILESIEDGYFEVDLAGNMTLFNPAMCKIANISAEELLGMNNREYTSPDTAKKMFNVFNEIYRTGQPGTLKEYEIIKKDDIRGNLELSVSLIRNPEGSPIGFRGIVRDVTERKMWEDTLRRSEEKYRSILENIQEGYFEVDLAGKLTFFNDVLCKLSGYSRNELLSMQNMEYLASESAMSLRKVFGEVYKTGQPSGIVDYDVVTKDGKIVHAELSASLIKDEKGKSLGFRAVARNVTERKRAEEALRESKEQYRTLVENASDIVFRTDGTGHFTFINQAAVRITGYEEQEIIGRHYPTLIHPDMRDEAIKFFGRQFVKRIQNTYLEYPLLTKEGHKLWCGQNTQLIFEDDHVVGFQAVARDITERKQAEEELKRSEERYRTILDEIEDGYQEVDLSGNFTFFNESFRKIFGYSENELLGSNFRRYAADEETADRVYRAYNQMYKTGNPLKRFEWDVITKDGARRSIEFSASLLRDGEGHRRGFRGIVRDVTDRKFVEEQYRTMANSAQTGVYIVQDGRLCFVNPHIPSYSGYPEEELIGERVLHFVHPDDRKMVREMSRKMLARELTAPYEYRIMDKNNQVRWIMETVTPISYKGKLAVLGNTMDTTERKRTEEELLRTLESLRKAFGVTIQVMVSAVEARDPYTAGHQVRSANLARAIATEMGLSQNRIDGIRMAGSIHDIGKLSIPAEILSKPTQLTELEFSLIKEHPRKGYEMLKDVESPWPLAQIVYQHHERMDGSGYPGNLKRDDILMEARIMAVADVVESMASHRPYRPALGINKALEEIENNKGTLYDADAADACLRLFREKGFHLEET